MTITITIADAAPAADTTPAKTIPTLPSSTAAVTPSTVASGPATGIGIRAAATLPEFLPVVNAIIGSTGDVVGELATLADVPIGIPSPDGSSIRGFSVAYFGADEHFVATATFDTTATAADAVIFYQASLSASGFTPVADSGSGSGEESTRSLQFRPPASSYAEASVEVAVAGDGSGADVELTIVDAIDGAALDAFTGWAAGLPALADAEPIEASITVTSGEARAGFSLTVHTSFAVDGYGPGQLAAAVRASLPDGGFSLDPEDSGSDTSVGLRHVAMRQLRCDIADADGATGARSLLTLSGTIVL
jgi:hypothetical protein